MRSASHFGTWPECSGRSALPARLAIGRDPPGGLGLRLDPMPWSGIPDRDATKRRPKAPFFVLVRQWPLAAAGALFEPGHLRAIAAPIRPMGRRLCLRRTLTLSGPLTLGRPLGLSGP